MRSDEFRARFKLLEQFTRRGVQSYSALDREGRSLMVHVISLPPTELQKLLGLLEDLAPHDRKKITDRLEVDGAPVLVTEMLDDFETLPRWLVSRRQVPAGAPEPSEPGEFTRLFMAVQEQPAATPPPEAQPTDRPPGEFTGLFGPRQEAGEEREQPTASPPAREAEAEAEAAGEPAAGAAPEKSGPGEFTRVFGGKAAPSEPEEAAEEPGRKQPKIRWREEGPPEEEVEAKPVVRWKKKGRPEAPPPPKPVAPPVADDVEATRGEFTKMFGQPAAPPAGQEIGGPKKEPASPLDRSTGEYLSALGASTPVHEDVSSPASPGAIEPPKVVPPVDAPPSRAPAPPDGGPSEFTRLVSGGAARPDATPPVAAPDYDEEPAAPRRGPTVRVLVIGLSAIVLAIVVLIILFAVL